MKTNAVDLTPYVVERIRFINDELSKLRKTIKLDEEMLEFEEQKIEEEVKKMKQKLQKMGWNDEDIRQCVISRYDAAEDWLDDVRAEITKKRDEMLALENDLIIFENYGR